MLTKLWWMSRAHRFSWSRCAALRLSRTQPMATDLGNLGDYPSSGVTGSKGKPSKTGHNGDGLSPKKSPNTKRALATARRNRKRADAKHRELIFGVGTSLSRFQAGLIENPPQKDFSDFEFFFDRHSAAFDGGLVNKPVAAPSHTIPEQWDSEDEDDGFCGNPLPRIDKIQESIDTIDQYIKYVHRNDRPLVYERIISEKLDDKVTTSLKWTKAVNLMKDCREMKEILLQGKLTNEKIRQLDRLDSQEERALGVLYGNFRFLSGISDQLSTEVFDKDLFDELMEEKFGSLNRHGQDLNKKEARLLFSEYLVRKVWTFTPWRKIQGAIEKFYDRVVRNPIKADMDKKSALIAVEILEVLLRLGRGQEKEFREFEPAPEASCHERSKIEGGKRFAMLKVGGRRIKHWVKPVAIFTGGKIRVITKDSVEFVKYNWINKFLGAQFRKLPCSVFGGKVEEWFEKVGGLVPNDDQYYVSGDLEAATDNFDGRISDLLIERIAEEFDLDSEEMKSFTTHAYLDKKRRVRQTRGQLMGSVISFPLLCILSLTAYVRSIDHSDLLKSGKKAKSFLMKLKSVGINGDDVVFCANREGMKRWEEGVKSIGGIVSRGKTLVNRNFFTINSELWCRHGKVNCLRPSLLTALTGDNKYFIQPQKEWVEFKNSTIVSKEGEKIWNLVEKLNLNIPVCLGGVGLVKRFDPDSMFDHFVRRKLERIFTGVKIASSGFIIEQNQTREALSMYGPSYPCYISKEMKKAWTKRFNSNKFNFDLKPHEIRFCLSELARPDIFDTEYLEPFRKQFEELKFDSVKDTLDSLKFHKHQIVRYLERMYDDWMGNLKPARIPVLLMEAYGAHITDETAADIETEKEFRLDHGLDIQDPCFWTERM